MTARRHHALRSAPAALAAAWLCLVAADAGAARTRLFVAEGYDEFSRGKLSGVTVTSEGLAFPGPKPIAAPDPGARTIWTLVPDGRGGVIAATGDGGLVLRQGPGQNEEPERLGELFDAEVFAACVDRRGLVHAAGAPVGTVMRLESGASATTLFDLPEPVVLALLARDDGTILAATGDRGRLYRINADGEGEVVYEAPDLSLRCLAGSSAGRVWAGTDGRGLVLEIDPDRKSARIWYDAAEEEIVALVANENDGLVFAANPGPAASSGPGADVAAPGGRDPRSGVAPSAQPAVYRLEARGQVRRIWTCPEKMIHALAIEPDGSVLVATSGAAGVYRVDRAGRASLVWRAEEEQVLSLAVQGSAIWAGTGNPGRIYRLTAEPAEEGSITGRVIDAGDQAVWGALRWTGSLPLDGVRFETRSGYTSEPDESWSEWTTAERDGDASKVSSPPGRCLQWRASFQSSGGEPRSLRRVEIAAAMINTPPVLSQIRLSPDEPTFLGGDPARGGLTQVLASGIEIDYNLPPPGVVKATAEDVPGWVRRLRSLVWDASDADGDELMTTLEIREAGETAFRRLARDLRDRAWTLDEGLLPDGEYEIRVTVSDAPSNGVKEALTDSRLTPSFRVDSVPPVLSDIEVRLLPDRLIEVSGLATDAISPVRRVDASVDGGAFQRLLPEDGLLDTRAERFRGQVALRPEEVGSWIVIRAQDAAGNRGLHRAWIADR